MVTNLLKKYNRCTIIEFHSYSVEINKPYSGTIIPNKYFNRKEK